MFHRIKLALGAVDIVEGSCDYSFTLFPHRQAVPHEPTR
jgi:hypothetical protein